MLFHLNWNHSEHYFDLHEWKIAHLRHKDILKISHLSAYLLHQFVSALNQLKDKRYKCACISFFLFLYAHKSRDFQPFIHFTFSLFQPSWNQPSNVD